MYGGLLQQTGKKKQLTGEDKSIQRKGETVQLMTGMSNIQDVPPTESEIQKINIIIGEMGKKLAEVSCENMDDIQQKHKAYIEKLQEIQRIFLGVHDHGAEQEVVSQIKEWRNELKRQIEVICNGKMAGEAIGAKMQNDVKEIEELFGSQFGREMAERELAVLDDRNMVDSSLVFCDANNNSRKIPPGRKNAKAAQKLKNNDGTATWDAETCTLTLENITLNTSATHGIEFHTNQDVTISLEGTNTINWHERGGGMSFEQVIQSKSKVNFQGSGTLNIKLKGKDASENEIVYKVKIQEGSKIDQLEAEASIFNMENSEEQLNEKKVDLNEWLQLLEKMIKDGGIEGEALDYETQFQNIIKHMRDNMNKLGENDKSFEKLFEITNQCIRDIKQQENKFRSQDNDEKRETLSKWSKLRKEIQEICVENMPEEERTPMKWKPKKLEAKCAKFANRNLKEMEEAVNLLTKHGGKAAWELATSTLVLENIIFCSRGENGMSIHLPDNAKILLQGKNEIHIGKGNQNAIKGEGNLTIDGSGTLDIVTYETKSGKTQPVGIEAKETLTIQGGDITIFEGAEDIKETKGVRCKNLNIAGGELKVGGGIQISENIDTDAGISIQYKTKDGEVGYDENIVKNSAGGVQWLKVSAPKQGGNVKLGQGNTGKPIGNKEELRCVDLEDTKEQGEIDECLNSWKKNGGSAEWDSTNRTLILDNVNLEGVDPGGDYVIRLPDNSIIELKGTNTIHVNPNQFGIYTDSDLTIQGSGILNLISKSGGDCLDCVNRDDILQNNQVKVVMFSEGKRRNRTNKTDENEKWEKIDEVRDKVAKKGITLETLQDIKEAGKIVLDELKESRTAEWIRSDNAVKEYDASEIKKKIEEAQSKRKKAKEEYEQCQEEEKINAQKKWEQATSEFWELYLDRKAVEFRRKIRAAKRGYEKTVDENAEELKSTLSLYRHMEIQETGAKRNQKRDQRFAAEAQSKTKRDEFAQRQAKENWTVNFTLEEVDPKKQQKLKDMFQDIVEHYPASFVEASDKKGEINVQVSDRGFYFEPLSMIAVSGSEKQWKKVGYHEYGHRMECSVPELKEAEALFLQERENKYKRPRLSVDSLPVVDGDFIISYIGRTTAGTISKSSDFEIVSVGFQYAYTNPTKLWRDQDYAQFIYGLLAVIGKP